jgi:predicted transcriptional regulator
MKTAPLPSLCVDPELRQAVESVLHEGESLSSFMERSLRDEVKRRRIQAEFIARGLAAREEGRQANGGLLQRRRSHGFVAHHP